MSQPIQVSDVPESTAAVARGPWVPPALTLESMRHVAVKTPHPFASVGVFGPAS